MTLILLLFFAAILGYVISQTALGDRVEDVAGEAASQARSYVDLAEDKLGVGKRGQVSLDQWVTRTRDLPDDFRGWYLDLTEPEAQRFERALHAHGRATGMHTSMLINGELDSRPELCKIYVEAVSVYSQAYRKAREALKKEEEGPVEEDQASPENSPRVDGKVVAEKRVSRRKRNTQGELAAASS
jgi:hypothetical protein